MPLIKMTKGSIDVGIVVKDLERAAKFYGEVLGFPQVRELEVSKDKANQAGCASGRFRFKAFQAGEVQLKLAQADADPASGGGKVDSATGYRYITFMVESVEETLKALQAAGVKPAGQITEVVPGRFILFFQDPDGNMLECVGPK
jgi:catechol 2,3-dioxygenase-like lactoylglutathione lyase family enzyme